MVNMVVHRPQGDSHILLPLSVIDSLLPHYRCRCRTSRLRSLPLFRRRTSGIYVCYRHLPPHQWFRRVSTIRRWYTFVALDASAMFLGRLAHLVFRFAGYFQVLGRLGSDQYRGVVCRALPPQRHPAFDICRPSSSASGADFGRPVASWAHCFRRLLFRRRPSVALCR